jgi:hypothetical protein
MPRDGEGLPKGWEHPIPDAIWPEALISAVRTDVGALASPRVIETIRKWRTDSRDFADPRKQREARDRLRALAEALVPPEISEVSEVSDLHIADIDAELLGASTGDANVRDVFADDSGDDLERTAAKDDEGSKPPAMERTQRAKEGDLAMVRSQRRIHSSSGEISIEDDAILGEEPASAVRRVSQIEAIEREVEQASAMPSREFEDEKPTTLREAAKMPLPSRQGGFYRAARVDPFADEDEKPTASITIPEDVQRRVAAAAASEAARDPQRIVIRPDDTSKVDRPGHAPNVERKPPSRGDQQADRPGIRPQAIRAVPLETMGADPEDDVHVEPREERTVAAGDAPLTPLLPSPPPSDDAGSRLAPKPGIVKRRAVSRRDSPARPRAAMQNVKALHAVVLPFCEELIPLSVERRSRRFWARWREIAGDRGVRREFVEELLQSANDTRTLVCELIAEVQNVDVKSVYTLVSKIESDNKKGSGPKPVVPPERQRGPIANVSVRIEGVSGAEKDED